jgi:hypothetical protein
MRTADGGCKFYWATTPARIKDSVLLQVPPEEVLPVIFVPGIMGSNLRNIKSKEPVWKLNSTLGQPIGLLRSNVTLDAGQRQQKLNPSQVEVDPGGVVPKKPMGSVINPKVYVARGWGEVGETSYGEYLFWLEQVLNGQGFYPEHWSQFAPAGGQPEERQVEKAKLKPGMRMVMKGLPERCDKGQVELHSDDLIARARFHMPVYACGYNWLDSNVIAAKRLKERIKSVIQENNHAYSHCSQVIVVTHSMGGLVARACQQLDGMQDLIAGIVHGVMPSVGAAVAYRRCKIGMKDEDAVAGMVIGNTGPEVTAVFAQAPGALQLLPSAQYRAGWLTIESPSGRSIGTEPRNGDPYRDIYLCEDRWWGLIRKEWLSPPGGTGLKWEGYTRNLSHASKFHKDISNSYHPNTFVFYGKDRQVASFEGVHWQIRGGAMPPSGKSRVSPEQVRDLGFSAVRDDGSNPLRVGGGLKVMPMGGGLEPMVVQSSDWDLVCAKQDGGGDGTVPVSSGAFPLYSAKAAIQHQFGLDGIQHEPAYKNPTARLVTLYALQKIAAKAKTKANAKAKVAV